VCNTGNVQGIPDGLRQRPDWGLLVVVWAGVYVDLHRIEITAWRAGNLVVRRIRRIAERDVRRDYTLRRAAKVINARWRRSDIGLYSWHVNRGEYIGQHYLPSDRYF